jgi:subtilisin family serine protease
VTRGRPRRPVLGGRGAAAAVGLLSVVALGGVAAADQDPYRPQQWNLERIGAPSVWSGASGEGQVVAVVDSGVDLDHPDLADRLVRDDDGRALGRDVVEDDDVPQDPLGHGTMVAGIAVATADNGVGIAGVAPQARLLPVRVLDEDGRGTSRDVDEGIRWAVDHGATVVNLSLESAASGDGDTLLGGATVAAPVEAVQYAWDRGVVVVAAAGNSGSGFTDYPSSSPVVLVGASDRDDERTSFSDSGRDDLLMAPGVDIVSTWCREAGDDRCAPDTHSYGIADGTSFAAPHVAGALAVLRSAGLDPEQAVQRLRATARDLDDRGRDDRTGYGLVDVAAAADGVSPAPSPGTATSPASPPPTASPTPSPAPSPTGTPSTPASPTPTDAATSPTSTTPTPPTSRGEVTTPRVEAAPAVPPSSGAGTRTAWATFAATLVVATLAAHARAWPDDQR